MNEWIEAEAEAEVNGLALGCSYGGFLSGFLAPELEEDHVTGSTSHGQKTVVGAHGHLLDGQMLFSRFHRQRWLAVGPQRLGPGLLEYFARLQAVQHLQRQRRRVPELDRPVSVPKPSIDVSINAGLVFINTVSTQANQPPPPPPPPPPLRKIKSSIWVLRSVKFCYVEYWALGSIFNT